MLVVRMPIEELTVRGNRIQQMLTPLAGRAPFWRPISSSTKMIIGAHEGAPTESDYRGWRFGTIVSNLRAQYFELWRRAEDSGEIFWYLDRAYLNIFQFDSVTGAETKYLCLHCDPNINYTYGLTSRSTKSRNSEDDEDEDDVVGDAKYKRGPHLHIKAASYPFTRAHIALNVPFLEQVLSSTDMLSESLEHAVLMLKDEVLEALNKVNN